MLFSRAESGQKPKHGQWALEKRDKKRPRIFMRCMRCQTINETTRARVRTEYKEFPFNTTGTMVDCWNCQSCGASLMYAELDQWSIRFGPKSPFDPFLDDFEEGLKGTGCTVFGPYLENDFNYEDRRNRRFWTTTVSNSRTGLDVELTKLAKDSFVHVDGAHRETKCYNGKELAKTVLQFQKESNHLIRGRVTVRYR